jgi:uncharacterized protein (TIGR02594 family)
MEDLKLHWLDVADNEMGVKEVVGEKSNPVILEYFKATTYKATEDSVPWCAAFVSWCLEKSGIESTKSAWSLSYLNWGIQLGSPKVGCVAVLYRGLDKNKGHVGFVVGYTPLTITLLGGNQGDQVCLKTYPRAVVRGYRWPKV